MRCDWGCAGCRCTMRARCCLCCGYGIRRRVAQPTCTSTPFRWRILCAGRESAYLASSLELHGIGGLASCEACLGVGARGLQGNYKLISLCYPAHGCDCRALSQDTLQVVSLLRFESACTVTQAYWSYIFALASALLRYCVPTCLSHCNNARSRCCQSTRRPSIATWRSCGQQPPTLPLCTSTSASSVAACVTTFKAPLQRCSL